MSQSFVAKIKGGKITLPKDLQEQWGANEVVFVPDQNGAYIKPVTPPSLSALKPKLKKLGKRISSRDIEDAVKWARQRTYAGRV